MNYRQDNFKKAKNIKVTAALLAIGVAFYFFSESILSVGFSIISYAAVPLWQAENGVSRGFMTTLGFLRSKGSLLEENRALKERLEDINVQLISMDAVFRENQELMIEMGNQKNYEEGVVVATVLSGPNIPPYDSLIINAGSGSGIQIGDRVLYGENVLLGEVSQLYGKASRVNLYSGSGIVTEVFLPTKEGLYAVAKGFGSGNFYLELPSAIPVDKGMVLSVPGGEVYTLGIVDYVKIDVMTASQKILARSPLNIKSVRFVRVIKQLKNDNLE